MRIYLNSLTQFRDMAWVWKLNYNYEHPHESLDNIPPVLCRQNWKTLIKNCFINREVGTMIIVLSND